MDVKKLKETLVGAGIEVYRTRTSEIHVAERVRYHLMDSGIRVKVAEDLEISFTARSQRSDFPEADAADLFTRVRQSIGPGASERGYTETWSGTTPVRDPVDGVRVLDVWHEVTWSKAAKDPESAVDEIRWALGLERYVTTKG